MIAVIFEVEPRPGQAARYFAIAGELRAELETIDGFISVERFESISSPGKYLSLSFWRDQDAVRRWRGTSEHRGAQRAGREEVFDSYRLRVATVLRDYGMNDRGQAPADSQTVLVEPP